jgi:hypothetical protein
LGTLGPVVKSAVPKLKSLVDHSDGGVGAAAKWAIEQIEKP